MISSNSALYFLINDFIQGNVSLKTNVKQMWLGQYWGFPGGAIGKELAYQCRRHKILGFHTWVGKIPWRRAWQPPPVLLPEKSHGQRSLVGYNPWDSKELDTTERINIYIVFVFLTTFYRYRFLAIIFPFLVNTICVLTGKTCR